MNYVRPDVMKYVEDSTIYKMFLFKKSQTGIYETFR